MLCYPARGDHNKHIISVINFPHQPRPSVMWFRKRFSSPLGLLTNVIRSCEAPAGGNHLEHEQRRSRLNRFQFSPLPLGSSALQNVPHLLWRKFKSSKKFHNFWHWFLALFTKLIKNCGVPEMIYCEFLLWSKNCRWNRVKMVKNGPKMDENISLAYKC